MKPTGTPEREAPAKVATALAIAGSDPSGGAGIQADLKTFSFLKVYGMAVPAALTAQNTVAVTGVLPIPPDFISEQLDAVMTDIMPDAVKTGMLGTAAAIEAVAAKLRQYSVTALVVDPVMTASSGAPLLDRDGEAALRRLLLPLALVVTPNLDEARALTGRDLGTPEDMEEAALQIHHEFGPKHVVVKGGHLENEAIDVLFDGAEFVRLESPRIPRAKAHGSGCVFSAATTAFLARGESVVNSVRLAKGVVRQAILNRLAVGRGDGPCDAAGILV